jgi:hypothetical protein
MAVANASCSASGSLEAASNAFLRDLVTSAPVRQTIDNLIPSSQAIEALASLAGLEGRVRRRELLAHV